MAPIRLPRLAFAASALWAAWWYARAGQGAGLLAFAAVFCAACVATRRSLRATTRAVVWTSVALLVCCLAANLARVSPGHAAGLAARGTAPQPFWDRLATVLFAAGLAALPFRPVRRLPALALLAHLPLLTLALARLAQPFASEVPSVAAPVAGAAALFVLLAQACGFARGRAAPGAPPSAAEARRRLAACLAAPLLAAALAAPVALAAQAAFEAMSGIRLEWLHWARPGASDALGLLPPVGNAHRVRPVLSILAPEPPGYLRASVYTVFTNGIWKPAADARVRDLVAGENPRGDRFPPRHPLPGAVDADPESLRPWTVRVQAPGLLLSVPVPAGAAWIDAEDPDDGSMTLARGGVVACSDGSVPLSYDLGAARGAGFAAWAHDPPPLPFPAPAAPDSPLATNLAAWASEVPGLAAATNDLDAIGAVAAHFRDSFAYSTETRYGSGEQALVRFMEARRGHCTLFATATALLLAHRGVPARVVGGFLCLERHPWTGAWIARQRDAHAWVEAWDRGRGAWVLVDATPMAEAEAAQWPLPPFLRLLRDAASDLWSRLQTLLAAHNPLVYVALAGTAVFTAARDAALSPAGAAALVLAAAALLLLRRRRLARLPEAERLRRRLRAAMRRASRRLAPRAPQRRPDEPWSDWAARVAPGLPPDSAARLRSAVGAYEALRYAPAPDPAAADAFLARLSAPGGWRPTAEL